MKDTRPPSNCAGSILVWQIMGEVDIECLEPSAGIRPGGRKDRELRSMRFINESVDVYFEQAPVYEKTPDCPSSFIWRGTTYHIVSTLSEWRDYQRRGRMARNMSPAHAAAAEHRGSWGVGAFYFRVQTDQNRIFDLYYDRAPKDSQHRKGSWFLYQELAPDIETGF